MVCAATGGNEGRIIEGNEVSAGTKAKGSVRVRILCAYPDYRALSGALEAGLVRTMEDAVTMLKRASAPRGPMGAE
jgi:hypothetical protein